ALFRARARLPGRRGRALAPHGHRPARSPRDARALDVAGRARRGAGRGTEDPRRAAAARLRAGDRRLYAPHFRLRRRPLAARRAGAGALRESLGAARGPRAGDPRRRAGRPAGNRRAPPAPRPRQRPAHRRRRPARRRRSDSLNRDSATRTARKSPPPTAVLTRSHASPSPQREFHHTRMRPGTRYTLEVNPRIPERLERLRELAGNLWYSWHRPTRALFATLNPSLWEATGHCPKAMLRQLDEQTLIEAASDPAVLDNYA